MPGKEGYTQKTYGLNANPPPSLSLTRIAILNQIVPCHTS
jgi:hypothetical protein